MKSRFKQTLIKKLSDQRLSWRFSSQKLSDRSLNGLFDLLLIEEVFEKMAGLHSFWINGIFLYVSAQLIKTFVGFLTRDWCNFGLFNFESIMDFLTSKEIVFRVRFCLIGVGVAILSKSHENEEYFKKLYKKSHAKMSSHYPEVLRQCKFFFESRYALSRGRLIERFKSPNFKAILPGAKNFRVK